MPIGTGFHTTRGTFPPLLEHKQKARYPLNRERSISKLLSFRLLDTMLSRQLGLLAGCTLQP